MIPDADRIQQRLKIESLLLHVLQSEVIRNCSEREDHLIVDKVACRAVFECDSNPPSRQIHFADASPDYLSAPQAGSQRRTDVTWFQAAPGDLREHRSEEQSIGIAHQRERDGSIGPENLFEILRRGHTSESAAENDNMLRLWQGRFDRLGLGTELGQREIVQCLPD